RAGRLVLLPRPRAGIMRPRRGASHLGLLPKPVVEKGPAMARANDIEAPKTMADLLEELGGIDPRRVALTPPPGKVTEKALIRLNEHTNRLYELVDGALVEKVMGFPEAVLASELIRLLGNFVHSQGLGVVAGPDAAMRVLPGLVRLPDVSFVS